ncbi:MAG: hypothetical protein SXV54_28265 [Chloroflexota bacterium]|nr:hypothetical protein [Chloroflexota bacterium]
MFKRNKTTEPKAAHLLPPTQDHLHVRGIVEGVVISDDGTLARVMEVLPVDLTMMGQGERERYRLDFGRAIASIRHPLAIQIVIASRPQTCDEYRRRLKARAQRLAHRAALSEDPAERDRRERMAERALRWAAFVETQLSFVRPLEEQYLVVVWYNPFPLQAKRRVLSHERFQEGKQELERRFALVMNVMRQADLQVRPLSDQELLAVMYRFYHWSLSPLGVGVMPRVLSMQPSLYVDVPHGREDDNGER